MIHIAPVSACPCMLYPHCIFVLWSRTLLHVVFRYVVGSYCLEFPNIQLHIVEFGVHLIDMTGQQHCLICECSFLHNMFMILCNNIDYDLLSLGSKRQLLIKSLKRHALWFCVYLMHMLTLNIAWCVIVYVIHIHNQRLVENEDKPRKNKRRNDNT